MANFSLLAKLGADTSAYQSGIKGAETRTDKFKSALSKLGPAIAAVGLTGLVRNAMQAGRQVNHLGMKVRSGVEELQELQKVGRDTGASMGAIERALRNVTMRTEEAMNGNKSYAEAFERLNIDIKQFSRLPTERKMEEIAKAQKNAGDTSRAFTDVATILGQRAGPELQGVLDELANKGFKNLEDAARSSGQVMDAEIAANMDRINNQIEAFKIATRNMTARAVSGFLTLGEAIGDTSARLIYGRDQTIQWTDSEIKAQQASKRRAKAEREKAEALRDTARAEKESQQASVDARKTAQEITDAAIAEAEKAVRELRDKNIFEAMAPKERIEFLENQMRDLARAAAVLNTETVEGAKKYRDILNQATGVYIRLQDEQKKLAEAEKERVEIAQDSVPEEPKRRETAEEAARRRAFDPFGADSFVKTGKILDEAGRTQAQRFEEAASNFEKRFDDMTRQDPQETTLDSVTEKLEETNNLLRGKFVNE
jgi:hypothetical protein